MSKNGTPPALPPERSIDHTMDEVKRRNTLSVAEYYRQLRTLHTNLQQAMGGMFLEIDTKAGVYARALREELEKALFAIEDELNNRKR